MQYYLSVLLYKPCILQVLMLSVVWGASGVPHYQSNMHHCCPRGCFNKRICKKKLGQEISIRLKKMFQQIFFGKYYLVIIACNGKIREEKKFHLLVILPCPLDTKQSVLREFEKLATLKTLKILIDIKSTSL